MRLLRARLSGWTRTPWALLLLFAADLVELSASIGLAFASPSPAVNKVPYAVIDVPTAPAQVTLGVAIMGVVAGLVMLAALVAEFWVMVRRAQIFSWRYGRMADRRAARTR
ncbi:MAG: hypothetical protein QM820_04155 [Minicystis sp.]